MWNEVGNAVCQRLAGAKRQLTNSPAREKFSLLGMKAPKPGGRMMEGWAWHVLGSASARLRNCNSQQLLDHLLSMVLHEHLGATILRASYPSQVGP